jgi:hypothetical protein
MKHQAREKAKRIFVKRQYACQRRAESAGRQRQHVLREGIYATGKKLVLPIGKKDRNYNGLATPQQSRR